MSSSNFPHLKPAFTFLVEIEPSTPIGSGTSARGSSMHVVPMVGGSLVSEPGYEIQLDGAWHGTGADYIRIDPDGKILRLDAHAVIKEKSGDGVVYINYKGKIQVNEAIGKVLTRADDMKTTEWGDAFTHLHFETGDEKLKGLENGVFVSAGRFVVGDDKKVVVEYKVSQVVI